MIKPPEDLRNFDSLIKVVEALRDPVNGCPWDLEQSHESLTKHLIEEAHECVEAIESKSKEAFIEELGDVLLQVILHSIIAQQNSYFSLLDVIEGLNKKLVFRHSHVFGEVKAANAKEALANWERMKADEKAKKQKANGFDIPVSLPALQRSQKIGEKTKKHNFDWSNLAGVRDKVLEELAEFDEAVKSRNPNSIEEEMGDLLFSVAQLSRHAGVDAESALRKANSKFESRFFKMIALAANRGQKLADMSSDSLEALWAEVKSQSK